MGGRDSCRAARRQVRDPEGSARASLFQIRQTRAFTTGCAARHPALQSLLERIAAPPGTLLIPQAHDRVEFRSALGGVDSEEQANAH